MGLEFELCSQGCHDSVILVLFCWAWRTQLHSGQPQIIQTIMTEEWGPAWMVAKSVKLVEIILTWVQMPEAEAEGAHMRGGIPTSTHTKQGSNQAELEEMALLNPLDSLNTQSQPFAPVLMTLEESGLFSLVPPVPIGYERSEGFLLQLTGVWRIDVLLHVLSE